MFDNFGLLAKIGNKRPGKRTVIIVGGFPLVDSRQKGGGILRHGLELAQNLFCSFIELFLVDIFFARPFAPVLADLVHQGPQLSIRGSDLITLEVYPSNEMLQRQTRSAQVGTT
jgi:hypothetical protein